MNIRNVVSLAVVIAASAASAQNLRAIPVPWVATDPAIPHSAYNGRATTFKAIARGGNGTWVYEWDFQGDGVYDFVASTSNRYDLSTRFTYPNQPTTRTFQARLRVTSGGQTVTAVYPVRVYADVPSNPALANQRQLEIMRSVAVDDGLWFLHRQLLRAGDDAHPLLGAQATANLQTTGSASSYQNTFNALFLEALGRQGHSPAFPEAYLGELPNPADNLQRWRDDPYAEDAMRVLNQLLVQSLVVSVTAADESNLTGFYPERSVPPLPGTDDGIGLVVGPAGETGPSSGFVRALAVSRLGGHVAQVGDASRILGRPFEVLLQQYVDGVVWAQNDSGYVGAWYYGPNSSSDLLGELGHGVMDAAEALAAAEAFMGTQGVVVPNLVKARLVGYVQQNLRLCPAGGTGGAISASYAGVCDFANSAAILHALRWVGAQGFAAADSRQAFPSYNAITRGSLRTWHDSTVTFISNVFNGTSVGAFGWDNGFVEDGDWTRTDGRGDHYAMFHWAQAARAGAPELVAFGSNDWARRFSQYLIRNQSLGGDWNWESSSQLGNHNDNVFASVGRAGWAVLTALGEGRAPFVLAEASLQTAMEGAPIEFSSEKIGEGEVLWSFGNGATAPGAQVTYAYPDNGSYNATASLSGPAGGSVDTVPVVITNAAPVAAAGEDLSAPEGTSLSFEGSFEDPGTDDTHSFGWDFGDGTTSNAQIALKAYADDGAFQVTFTVTDDDGASGVDSREVTVTNVAPEITSAAPQTAAEGVQYAYALTFTDPGTADTHVCSNPVGPANALLTGCALSWTPAADQAGRPQAFELCVTDDDGGRSCQAFTITPAPIDVDLDGLPDSWELIYFGSTGSAGPSGDEDGDGANNLQEFSTGTNPTQFDGPGSPGDQLPACRSTVAQARPLLTVVNASDPQASPLTYTFELYSDPALTQLVAAESNVAAGAGATGWLPPVLLLENATYYWRARARDETAFGPWTAPGCAFFVNVTDDLPTAPQPDSPDVGATVSSRTPTLTVRNAVDPDSIPLTYEVEVRRGEDLVASAQQVVEGAGTTSWVVSAALSTGTEFRWRARAVSPTGAGPWSVFSRFVVGAEDTAALEAPVLLSPQNGTVVDSLTPSLAFAGQGRAAVFDWQLATDATFNMVLASAEDTAATRVQPAEPLTEDASYCWRVRSDDGAAQSSWVQACFRVSATDGAPSVPTLANPGDDSVVATATPLFTWAAAVDPEGAPVSYELELSRGGAKVATVTGIGGTTALAPSPLEDGADYSWRVRAITGGASAASAFSAPNGFRVQLPGAEQSPEPSACGCGSSPSAALAPLFLWVLRGGRRRRRA